MAPSIPNSTLDAILAVQIAVAWAGEGRTEPPRLGWWATDLVDPAGGGDLLARLLPKTHRWAALEAVREAARRADEKARKTIANPDGVRTIFSLGFDLDERLGERLAELKRAGAEPETTLPLPLDLGAEFSWDGLASALTRGSRAPAYEITPAGRELKGAMPAAPELAVKNLAAALLPFAERYPLPFYRVAR